MGMAAELLAYGHYAPIPAVPLGPRSGAVCRPIHVLRSPCFLQLRSGALSLHERAGAASTWPGSAQQLDRNPGAFLENLATSPQVCRPCMIERSAEPVEYGELCRVVPRS